jgi:hypothetical protein
MRVTAQNFSKHNLVIKMFLAALLKIRKTFLGHKYETKHEKLVKGTTPYK